METTQQTTQAIQSGIGDGVNSTKDAMNKANEMIDGGIATITQAGTEGMSKITDLQQDVGGKVMGGLDKIKSQIPTKEGLKQKFKEHTEKQAQANEAMGVNRDGSVNMDKLTEKVGSMLDPIENAKRLGKAVTQTTEYVGARQAEGKAGFIAGETKEKQRIAAEKAAKAAQQQQSKLGGRRKRRRRTRRKKRRKSRKSRRKRRKSRKKKRRRKSRKKTRRRRRR